jgi:hypothetical protein
MVRHEHHRRRFTTKGTSFFRRTLRLRPGIYRVVSRAHSNGGYEAGKKRGRRVVVR